MDETMIGEVNMMHSAMPVPYCVQDFSIVSIGGDDTQVLITFHILGDDTAWHEELIGKEADHLLRLVASHHVGEMPYHVAFDHAARQLVDTGQIVIGNY